jgi:uncharacterized protein YdcH (DUF465 family)
VFHAFHDLIAELQAGDRYFQSLFATHGMLEQKIGKMEVCMAPGARNEIYFLKSKKLAIGAVRDSLSLPASLARIGA